MNLDRQLVRLMAAMIVMIIAYVAPSAVQAHEGHAHHGHQHAASAPETPVVATIKAPDVAVPAAPSNVAAIIPARSIAGMTLLALGPSASIRSDAAGAGCCPGACKGSCCGTMACCASGILPIHASLPTPAYGGVTHVAYDVAGLAGIGPEALPRPPRTLA